MEQFWIVAGPNGSGKSTLIRYGVLDRWMTTPLVALSPDDIVLKLRLAHPEWPELSLLRAAQDQSDKQVATLIASGTGAMVETVLSSDKFKPMVEQAKRSGLQFCFTYVTVVSADINVDRVRVRVADGGHDVPYASILQRRERSRAAFAWFAEQADIGLVFDNSGLSPLLLAHKQPDQPGGWHALHPARLATIGLRLPPLDPAPPPIP